jgi:acyl-CoA synthetase (NDP forming)
MAEWTLDSLIAPARIAIVGASADPAGHTGRTLANLIRSGYRGEILPVNPRYEEILGRRCYRGVPDLPDGVDVAYILLRAPGHCLDRRVQFRVR